MKAIIEYKNGSRSVGEVKFGDYDKESHEVSFNIVSDKMLNINAEELLKVVIDGTVIYDDRKHGKNTQTSQLVEDVVKSSKEGKLFKVIDRLCNHGFDIGEIVKYETRNCKEDCYKNQKGEYWFMTEYEVEEITLDGKLYQYVGKHESNTKYGDIVKYLHPSIAVDFNIYFDGEYPIALHNDDVRKIEFN